ncbi:MAG: hypothetical protein MJZ84_08635, partial [Paludibacteraceae bacterium]|nr:hypothetical protein [Paludibacteraceae bacterium]
MNSKGFSIWLIVVVVSVMPSITFAMSPAQEDSLRALFRIDEVEVVAKKHPIVVPAQRLEGERLLDLS